MEWLSGRILVSMHEALSFNPNTTKIKIKNSSLIMSFFCLKAPKVFPTLWENLYPSMEDLVLTRRPPILLPLPATPYTRSLPQIN
jgi:hypothetical protein